MLYAENLFISDTYDYNPLNETGNNACKKLEEKIKLKAIAKISGEKITQDMLEICNGSNNVDECISNTSTFYSLGNAKILDFKITEGPFFQELSDLLDNHYRCRMTAKINLYKIEFDPTPMMLPDHTKKQSRKVWESIVSELEALPHFEIEAIEQALSSFIKTKELKAKHIYFPMRMMLTGKKGSPPLFDTMAVLGKERIRTRMRNALQLFKQQK